MRNADAVLGLATLIAGGVILALSIALPEMPQSYAGPGLFPTLVGGGLIVAGFLLLLPTLRALRAGSSDRPTGTPEAQTDTSAADAFSWRGAVEVAAAVIAFMILTPRLGFVVGAFVMLVGLLLARGNRIGTSVAVGLGMTLVVRWLFAILLKVPLPMGPWGW